MKLKFAQPHKSIDQNIERDLEGLDFPNFSIITGTNGSGKTHLLEAIKDGNIIMESEDISPYGPSIYFNYNNFLLQAKSREEESREESREEESRQKNPRNSRIKMIGEGTNKVDSSVSQFVSQRDQFYVTTLLKEKRQSFFRNIDINNMLYNFWRKFSDDPNSIKRLEARDYDEVRNSNEYENGNLDIIGEINDEIFNFFRQNETLIESLKKRNKVFNTLYGHEVPYEGVYLGRYIFRSTVYYFRERKKYIEGVITGKIPNPYAHTTYEIHTNPIEASIRMLNEKYIEDHGQSPITIFNNILKEHSVNNYVFLEDSPDWHNMTERDFSSLNYSPQLTGDGVKLELQDLSSGEKILLALASLVVEEKYREETRYRTFSGVLLLDEIDTNLHPTMIENLLRVLQKVFIEEYNFKIILVTHSPTTIALASDECGFFTMGRPDEEGEPRIKRVVKSKALQVLTEGFATLGQGLTLLDQVAKHEVSIISEGNNIEYLEKAKEFFGGNNEKKIGMLHGIENKSGYMRVQLYFDLFTKCEHKNAVFLVLDPDVKDTDNKKDTSNTFYHALKPNEQNKIQQKGIESLFPENLFTGEFINGVKRRTKKKFLQHILKNATKEDFRNFKPLFDEINEVINNNNQKTK